MEHALEVVIRIALTHLAIEFRQPVQDPALKFRHVGRFYPLRLAEAFQRAQHIAHRVAQTAVAVGHAFQDLLPDAQVHRVVRLCHPQPQDIGAIFLGHLLRGGGVAEGLGHLHALLVQREAVGQHAPIGRAALGAAGLQH